jgi:hypothetical protein
MKRWSKLQARIYSMVASEIPFQIHYIAYPMRSQRGSTLIPRCYITIGKEIIWDFPRDFPSACVDSYFACGECVPIATILRQWTDTSDGDLLGFAPSADRWGLAEILLAVDRRMGQKRLRLLCKRTKNEKVKAIIAMRLNSEPDEPTQAQMSSLGGTSSPCTI